MMHDCGMMGCGGVMGAGMWIFMLLLWGFAIFGLICAIRCLVGGRKLCKKQEAPETPLDILRKRYAGGELSREEFERMQKELE